MKDLNQVVVECIMGLYEHSEPKADFLELVAQALFEKEESEQLDNRSFKISQEKFHHIMNTVISKYDLTDMEKSEVRTKIYIGPSPMYKD